MNQDKWIYTDKRSGKLVLRFWVKGYDKQFFIGTGLADTPRNRELARLRRDSIATDIALLRFDSSLERYRFHAPKNGTLSSFDKESKEKYKYNLAQLWEQFTHFKKAVLEQTTILVYYHGIARYIHKLPTNSLDKAVAIRDWLLENTTYKQAYKNLSAFSDCCEWALDSGLIPNNPFAKLKIKSPKRKSTQEDYKAFTLEQRDLIIEAYEQHLWYCHYAPLIKFLFFTGARLGEAFALTWGDVQENCTRIHINKACNFKKILKGTKNNKRRIFPTQTGSRLQQTLLDIRPLASSYSPSDLVFTTKTGSPINSDTLFDTWSVRAFQRKGGKLYSYPGVVRELAASGKLPYYLKPYSTRHTFATWAIATGITPDKVALWIGDEVTTVLRYYCHPNVVQSECPDF